MTPEELNAYWTRTFPECPPVGYLLKHLYRDRCVRFSMAQSDAGTRDANHHWALFAHLFEHEARVVLITTIPSELETPPGDTPGFLNFDPQGSFLHSLGMHEFELEFDTPSYWHLFMSVRAYDDDVFPAVMRASTDDTDEAGVVNTIFLGPAAGRLMYVYPGGVDIIMENAAKRDQLRERFQDWTV